jgi:hypothetical protein
VDGPHAFNSLLLTNGAGPSADTSQAQECGGVCLQNLVWCGL